MPFLNFKLRENGGALKQGHRGWMFTILFLHANSDLRCWPGDSLLMDEVGFSSGTLKASKDWLVKRNAIILVPYNKRMVTENHLPKRKHVYQITGIMKLDNGTCIPTTHFLTPEEYQSHRNILIDLGFDSLMVKELDSLMVKDSNQWGQSSTESLSGTKEDSVPAKNAGTGGGDSKFVPRQSAKAKTYDNLVEAKEKFRNEFDAKLKQAVFKDEDNGHFPVEPGTEIALDPEKEENARRAATYSETSLLEVEPLTPGKTLKGSPAKPERKRSKAQLANDARVEALGKAWGIESQGDDYGFYAKIAQTLNRAGIENDEFEKYVEHWRGVFKAKEWEFTLSSLTAKGRPSEYIVQRDSKPVKAYSPNDSDIWG